jgi:hypothetical protein
MMGVLTTIVSVDEKVELLGGGLVRLTLRAQNDREFPIDIDEASLNALIDRLQKAAHKLSAHRLQPDHEQ